MAVPLGKYELLRKIASGGMGQVFLARERQGGIERLVVLKLVLPHLSEDEDFLAMFLEEAQLVARLRHPNLITILEWTEVEGRHCLAMEYVQGDDVRRLDNSPARGASRCRWGWCCASSPRRPRACTTRTRRAIAQGRPLRAGAPGRVAAEHPRGLRRGREGHRLRRGQGGGQLVHTPPPGCSRASTRTCPRSRPAGRAWTRARTSSPWAWCSGSCSPASASSRASRT